MKQIHLTKAADGWWVAKCDDTIVAQAHTKREAVIVAARYAQRKATRFFPLSLVIHRVDGTIQEERTYPRGADPHTSPG